MADIAAVGCDLHCKASFVQEKLQKIVDTFDEKTKDLYPDFEDRVMTGGICNGFSLATIVSRNKLFQVQWQILYYRIEEPNLCLIHFLRSGCTDQASNLIIGTLPAGSGLRNNQPVFEKELKRSVQRLTILTTFLWHKLEQQSPAENLHLVLPCSRKIETGI